MSIFCEHLLGADININKQQGKLSKLRETLYIDSTFTLLLSPFLYISHDALRGNM